MNRRKIPTVIQSLTLQKLLVGWKLFDEVCSVTGQERIWWVKGIATIPCELVKHKRHQLKLIEKRGWIIKKKDQWYITSSGREVYKLYQEAYEYHRT